VTAWRLCRSVYSDLSGIGGTKTDGRWHEQGHKIVYTSSSLALAVLERRVHSQIQPPDDISIEISVPDALIEFLTGLPQTWKSDTNCTQTIGTDWLVSRRSAVLAVPSILVPELNYLINPDHPHSAAIKIVTTREFIHDVRLF
jgi:RES domain-containing protein